MEGAENPEINIKKFTKLFKKGGGLREKSVEMSPFLRITTIPYKNLSVLESLFRLQKVMGNQKTHPLSDVNFPKPIKFRFSAHVF